MNEECRVPWCTRPAVSNGLCNSDNVAWWKAKRESGDLGLPVVRACWCDCGQDTVRLYAKGHHPNLSIKRWHDGSTAADRYREKARADAFDAYGGRCACCALDEYEFLTIDHVNDDGGEQRRSGVGAGVQMYVWLRNNGWPEGYQVLCANCNMAKARQRGCPHRGVDAVKKNA